MWYTVADNCLPKILKSVGLRIDLNLSYSRPGIHKILIFFFFFVIKQIGISFVNIFTTAQGSINTIIYKIKYCFVFILSIIKILPKCVLFKEGIPKWEKC